MSGCVFMIGLEVGVSLKLIDFRLVPCTDFVPVVSTSIFVEILLVDHMFCLLTRDSALIFITTVKIREISLVKSRWH